MEYRTKDYDLDCGERHEWLVRGDLETDNGSFQSDKDGWYLGYFEGEHAFRICSHGNDNAGYHWAVGTENIKEKKRAFPRKQIYLLLE